VGARPIVVAGALLARLRLLRCFAVWPNAATPSVAFDPRNPRAGDWLRRVHEPAARRRRVTGAATWQALRARALLLPTGSSPAVEVAARALGRRLSSPDVAFLSSNGSRNKVMCFVFEGAASTPTAVVKTMADWRRADWLRREVDMLAAIRERTEQAPAVARRLPSRPLLTGTAGRDYFIVESIDRLAPRTGKADRSSSLAWLSEFHDATTENHAAWSEHDAHVAIEAVERGWRRYRRSAADAVVDEVRRRMIALLGRPVPRCGLHGDFWRGNIAGSADDLRVYDWEWAQLRCPPFFDMWTYELADLRADAVRPGACVEDELAAALPRVRGQISRAGLDEDFAEATLAPSAAILAIRIRDATATPNGWEDAAPVLFRAVETVLGRESPGGVTSTPTRQGQL